MKRHVGIIFITVLVLGMTSLAYFPLMGSDHANACGWGNPGGQDYVPQRRDSTGPAMSRPSITKEQAFDVAANHVKRLNPNLEVGQIRDAGGFYEAEILSEKREVIQLLGVDKLSGRLMLLN